MTRKIAPLNPTQHGKLKLRPSPLFAHLKTEQLVPIVVSEMTRIAGDFPFVFVKDARNDRLLPVAVMGFFPGENLYCGSDDWDISYAPMALQIYPFSLASDPANPERAALCIDENSELLGEEGEALFDEKGEQTEFLKARGQLTVQMVEQTELTRHFVDYISKKELLMPQTLQFRFEGGEPHQVNNVYIVNEERLKALPAEDVHELMQRGALPLLYAQLMSMQQMNKLGRRRQKLRAAQA